MGGECTTAARSGKTRGAQPAADALEQTLSVPIARAQFRQLQRQRQRARPLAALDAAVGGGVEDVGIERIDAVRFEQHAIRLRLAPELGEGERQVEADPRALRDQLGRALKRHGCAVVVLFLREHQPERVVELALPGLPADPLAQLALGVGVASRAVVEGREVGARGQEVGIHRERTPVALLGEVVAAPRLVEYGEVQVGRGHVGHGVEPVPQLAQGGVEAALLAR
jgi:hypothetical protein